MAYSTRPPRPPRRRTEPVPVPSDVRMIGLAERASALAANWQARFDADGCPRCEECGARCAADGCHRCPGCGGAAWQPK